LSSELSTLGLARGVLESTAFLPLTAQEYGHLVAARELVSEALAFEEKFDLLTANYLELEKTLNGMAAEHMIHADFSYQSMNDCRVHINQRVQNLLSACRLYLDHGAHHASAMESAVAGLKGEFSALCNKQYDASVGYRICEALRNHSQHRGFPIGGLSSGGGWVERPGMEAVLLHRIVIRIDVQAMREGQKTKESVLQAVESLKGDGDARPIIREYVAGLSTIHQEMRRKIDKSLHAAETVIKDARSMDQSHLPDTGHDRPKAALPYSQSKPFQSEAVARLKRTSLAAIA
jgi:hypothetical protein